MKPPIFAADGELTDTASAEEIRAFRSALRSRLIGEREALTPDEHARLSQALASQLAPLLAALPIRTLGFCWPYRAEFDARKLVAMAIARGLAACLPVVTHTSAPLSFRAWEPDSAMVDDRYGIHIPATGEARQPDAILMPLNAFDAAGYRLGYGGGYFDRTLATLVPRPLAIGIGFELARIASIRPQAHDLRMDCIVTETGIFIAENSGLKQADSSSCAATLSTRLAPTQPKNSL